MHSIVKDIAIISVTVFYKEKKFNLFNFNRFVCQGRDFVITVITRYNCFR